MSVASFKIEFPRRQAMLKIGEIRPRNQWLPEFIVKEEVPVLVWPYPTTDGYFIVEHQDGHCQKVQPYELTFLGSKELFDQYSWVDEETKQVEVSESDLVRHMVNMSGKTQSDVSESMGKSRGYVLASTSRGSSPSAANLAKLARACGYRFVLEGHGESISVIEG